MGIKQFIGANKQRILIGILLIVGIMQFFPIDKTNPSADPTLDFVSVMQPPAEVVSLFQNACYDCHSYTTEYPWYTNIAPVSWWIKKHINHGRDNLNFSLWGSYSAEKAKHKLEECAEKTLKTEMPLTSFLISHPEARISKEERKKLADWCLTQLNTPKGGGKNTGQHDHNHEGHDHSHEGHDHSHEGHGH